MWNSGKNSVIISLLNRSYDSLQNLSKSKYESLDKYLLLKIHHNTHTLTQAIFIAKFPLDTNP